jgi:CIC family chloride channel protein
MTDPLTNEALASHRPRWIRELSKLRGKRLRFKVKQTALALLTGVVAGLGAVAFVAAYQVVSHVALDDMAGYRPHKPGGEPTLFAPTQTAFSPWMLLLVPALGGLLSGWVLYTFAPEAEGGGTGAAIEAYHRRHGAISPRVPLIKVVASAITLGTGGSGGREGPIAQIGAGVGSYLGALLRLRPAERRVLMAAGMGAGVAAIFHAPLAGALFAAEVLYRSADFESEVIIPAGLASVTAYSTFGAVFGWSPLFTLPPELLAKLTFDNPLSLVPYLFLAAFIIMLGMAFTRAYDGLTRIFRELNVTRKLKPAIGGALSGALALGLYELFGGSHDVLAVVSFGFGALQDTMAIDGAHEQSLELAASLLAVALGKILTTSLTIGSGGSGGLFGPSVVIGGCGAGALGIVLHRIWTALTPHPGSFVIVGMAGFFAAVAKTPFSTLVIVSEMTGNYNLLLPMLWVCALAFLFSEEQSIYRSQVAGRSRSPAHSGDDVLEVPSPRQQPPDLQAVERPGSSEPLNHS